MLRFSARLKLKRETAAGQPERLLPHARRHSDAFLVHVACFLVAVDGSFETLASDVLVPAESDDSVTVLAHATSDAITMHGVEAEIHYKHEHLDGALLLGNCGIGRGTRLVALYRASPDLGVALYRAGLLTRAAAVLAHFVTGPGECRESDYAPFLADIYMRSSDPALASLERAAPLYLVAAHSCDATVYKCLARLSTEFARKLAAAHARWVATKWTPDETYATDAIGALLPDLLAELQHPAAADWANATAAEIRTLCRYYLDE